MRDGRKIARTPIALCWNNDNYYLVAYSPKFEIPFATFRVDRMTDVEILDEKADKYDKAQFKITDYVKQNLGMFTGETMTAKIEFDENLVSVVLDQFGSDTQLIKSSDKKFTIKVNVTASPVFLGWIFQFGDQAEILEPESLRETMLDKLKTGYGTYKGKSNG